MLQLIVLSSGSAGNCAVVCSGQSRLLIDAGLSAARLKERLLASGIPPESLSAILLTHEHGDHARGLDVLTRHLPLPILCNERTRAMLQDSCKSPKNWHLIPSTGNFTFADLEIDTFTVPHDAADPVGLVLRHRGAALGILSDAGPVTPLMRRKLQDLDTLFIEANYDPDLLSNDTKRPWSTKLRIQGPHGHLSNAQTAACVADLLSPRLRRILLGHLSEDCNSPDLAAAAVRAALAAHQRHDIELLCASAHQPTPWFQVRPSAPPLGEARYQADLF